jgi:hypothetical protein
MQMKDRDGRRDYSITYWHLAGMQNTGEEIES